MRIAIPAFMVLAAVFGCSPPPKDQAVDAFKRGVHLHFQNLNNEAVQRREDLRKGLALSQANPSIPAPTGAIVSTYAFDDAAFVVLNYKCKTCDTRLILPVPSAEYLCRACGHCPYVQHPANFNRKQSPCVTCLGPEGKPKAPADALVAKDFFAKEEGCLVKDMFELAEGASPEKPMKATVRYIRTQWSYDARGVVSTNSKITEKAAIDPSFLPTGGDVDSTDPRAKYQRAGYHRQDAVYIGELQFEYRAGDIKAVTRPREEPVRPWKDLGRNP